MFSNSIIPVGLHWHDNHFGITTCDRSITWHNTCQHLIFHFALLALGVSMRLGLAQARPRIVREENRFELGVLPCESIILKLVAELFTIQSEGSYYLPQPCQLCGIDH